MAQRRLIWQLYPSYVAVTLAAVLAIGWYATVSIEQFHTRQVERDLEVRARLVHGRITDMLNAKAYAELDAFCKKRGEQASTRITVVLRDGTVVADSDKPLPLENHADRPEIQAAYVKGTGSASRYSGTLERNMMYVAVRVPEGEDAIAVVRTSLPLTEVMAAAGRLYVRILVGGLVITVLAAAISLVISRRLARPLSEMQKTAEAFAAGELTRKIPPQNTVEVDALGEAMNSMAAQLDARIRTVTEQRNELEALLSSMTEAVLAVDREERVLRLNTAAARIFDIDIDAVEGQPLEAVVRNVALQEILGDILSGDRHAEREMMLRGERGDRFFQAHGTGLTDAMGDPLGAVVVLTDVTRLKKLENIRREFVANVSHELRTPVTAVKGFLETVREGKFNDPGDAARFLDIAARQADRLNAIIEDLLELSRIEQSEREGVRREPHRVRDVLENALSVCTGKVAAKNISLELDCPDDLQANVNGPLLEQALINLLDNAVKYSEPGQPVKVSGAVHDGELAIAVEDQGCGIPEEHLDRIFERFYRVDKARSRKLGGTGLGLAIVKHIVQATGGEIRVTSTPGEGSTFTIVLPQPRSDTKPAGNHADTHAE